MLTELINQREENKVHQFLISLGDSTFSTVQSSILQIELIPSIEKTYAIIIKEELQRNLVKDTKIRGEAVAFAASRTGQTKIQCTHYFKQGHKARNCYQLIG